MDAFAVSVCKGLSMKKVNYGHAGIIALYFGAFQALMPVLGWLGGSYAKSYIEKYDHWIAFGLLLFIGANMIREALKEEDRRLEEEDLWNYNDEGDRRWCKTIFEGIYSDEVMERYRLQEWWHFRYLDGRDCTGQWFTTDIKVFKIKELDRTIVYHIQHKDI